MISDLSKLTRIRIHGTNNLTTNQRQVVKLAQTFWFIYAAWSCFGRLPSPRRCFPKTVCFGCWINRTWHIYLAQIRFDLCLSIVKSERCRILKQRTALATCPSSEVTWKSVNCGLHLSRVNSDHVLSPSDTHTHTYLFNFLLQQIFFM